MKIPILNPTIKNGRCANIAQYWGENKELYLKNFCIAGHNGLDFAYLNPKLLPPGDSSYGQPILAAFAGKVTRVIWDGEHSTKGNGIYVSNSALEAVYWHLSAISVKVGELVGEGREIGKMGNSGAVFPAPTPQQPHAGTHLHFGIRPLKNGMIIYPNNGFDGFVDPLFYFNAIISNIMLNLYGDKKTKKQYVQVGPGELVKIDTLRELEILHDAGVINKDGVVWLDDLAVYLIIGVMVIPNI